MIGNPDLRESDLDDRTVTFVLAVLRKSECERSAPHDPLNPD